MTDNQRPPVLCLMGPTAAGKTDLALYLADNLPCELISVDSALVYRGMDIGTAKPDAETLAQYPHHLVDILDPVEAYSAAQFVADVLPLIDAAHAQGRLPLLVGGTMLYFRALSQGLAPLPAADPRLRANIEAQAKETGWAAVHAELARVDALSAARIHPNDPQRIQRALEVYYLSGLPLSAHHARQAMEKQQSETRGQSDLPYTMLYLAIAPAERSVLHARIAQRFEQMLAQGFVAEVEALHARGDLNVNMPSVRAVGYRQAWDYLDAKLSYAEFVERGIIATRQLAKRQLTWLRGWQSPIEWLDSLDTKRSEQALKAVGQVAILGNSQ